MGAQSSLPSTIIPKLWEGRSGDDGTGTLPEGPEGSVRFGLAVGGTIGSVETESGLPKFLGFCIGRDNVADSRVLGELDPSSVVWGMLGVPAPSIVVPWFFTEGPEGSVRGSAGWPIGSVETELGLKCPGIGRDNVADSRVLVGWPDPFSVVWGMEASAPIVGFG